MDSEKLKRRQSLKVIISETFMVIAVIITVIILAFVVSGYWLNSDLKVERQGMLQIYSTPTGADLDVDGESSWLQRTNTSKVLSSGSHTITLTKEGYDSWTKTIDISEGLLYRIHYPRLFLQNREPAKALDASGASLATISPDSETLLLINDTTEWSLVDLRNDTLQPKKLNISNFFSDTSLADGASVGLFSGKIIKADWDQNGDHILFKVESNGATEWVLLDVRNVKNSLNLTKEFGDNFSKIEILDNSSSNLLAVQNGNLRRIDVSGKSISAVLVEDIYDFDHYENEVVFSASDKNKGYQVGIFKIGDSETKKLTNTTDPAKVSILKFYDETFIATLQNTELALYKKVDFEPIANFELSFAPNKMTVGAGGAFIAMSSAPEIATLDMENTKVREWRTDGDAFDWLDNDMIYSVADGELIVYDFDGFNRRILAKNVSSRFPVTITSDKWLYYFSDNNLIREQIIE